MEIKIDAQSTSSSCKSNWKKIIVDQSQSIMMDLHKQVMTLSHIYHTTYLHSTSGWQKESSNKSRKKSNGDDDI